MPNCRSCNFMSCPDQGNNQGACSEHQDFAEPAQDDRDAFVNGQPQHKMAH